MEVKKQTGEELSDLKQGDYREQTPVVHSVWQNIPNSICVMQSQQKTNDGRPMVSIHARAVQENDDEEALPEFSVAVPHYDVLYFKQESYAKRLRKHPKINLSRIQKGKTAGQQKNYKH